MPGPLVSVIIPSYNRAKLISQCINSITAQTYPNIEIIVIDDGSTDETVDVVSRRHPNVKLRSQRNAGPSAARNHGVALSRGEFIAFQDSDDLWLPDKIERQVALLTRLGKKVSCCVCNTRINAAHPAKNGRQASSFDFANLSRSCPREGVLVNAGEILSDRFVLFNQAVAMSREAFEKTKGYPEDLRLLEDYYLAFSLALQGPWAMIRDELVKKDNDTQGIGVQAMHDKRRHLHARVAVLERIIDKIHEIPPGIRARLMRKLQDAKKSLKELDREKPSPLAAIFVRVRTSKRRLFNAFSRRILGPHPKFEKIC